MSVETVAIATELGFSVPNSEPHAISVSLPTWRDNVDYEEGKARVVDSMKTGYPRFFIHMNIQKLSRICQAKFGLNGEACLLFPSSTYADQCRSFLKRRSEEPIQVRLAQYSISTSPTESPILLHIVFFPVTTFPLAKQFWQHTGNGISSRMAETCLFYLSSHQPLSPTKKKSRALKYQQENEDDLTRDHGIYLEERYARNLPSVSTSSAKKTLQRRIAGVLLRDSISPSDPIGTEVEVGDKSWRGVRDVNEDDVWLYPTGMSAIWHAHQLALRVLDSKSVCFGFPYTDTLKILQKWGPGCHFLGTGLDYEIPLLESILQSSTPPITALFCEFPSNPLLRSPNLKLLRKLADEYGFLIIVDETIGNFVNVDVLKYADIVVSSITKVFSGETNVMGGSMVLNPQAPKYEVLKRNLQEIYEDTYWSEDAIFMERNSRDFKRRIDIINKNAELIADLLRSQSEAYCGTEDGKSRIIKEVFYPKWVTRENFDACRNPVICTGRENEAFVPSGFGGLLSIAFTSKLAAQVFFDNLGCEKGPSLGTNFTLACPYTILAHYNELDWARSYGVDPELVRVSVGMEDQVKLKGWFQDAICASELACSVSMK